MTPTQEQAALLDGLVHLLLFALAAIGWGAFYGEASRNIRTEFGSDDD